MAHGLSQDHSSLCFQVPFNVVHPSKCVLFVMLCLVSSLFRRAGKLHREKLENRFVPFKFRHGSSPILTHQESL